MKEKTIRDVMVPIGEFGVVDTDATVYDALHELRESQNRARPSQFLHRAVLIRDKKGVIVGKIGHWSILKALEPKYKQEGNLRKLSRAGLTPEYVNAMGVELDLLEWDLTERCKRLRHVNVTEIMRPVTEQVDIDASLAEAIHQIVTWNTLSVLVIEKGRVVGLLRMADLFHEVREIILSEDDE